MLTNQKWTTIKIRKISPDSFAALAASNKFFLLDVRPLEFSRNNSFIKGAVHCPLVYLEKYYSEIPKECKIILADYAMISATNAAKFLITKGYNVKGVLKGGIERWISEKKPVEERLPEPVPFSFTWKNSWDACR
jgi:rhodanese-related sulfurtransferase